MEVDYQILKNTQKRLRAPNFTLSENELLLDTIEKYKNIIENKKTDAVNIAQKQRTWMSIAADYNATTTGVVRSLENLQQAYKNLKRKTKKNNSDNKMTVPPQYSLPRGAEMQISTCQPEAKIVEKEKLVETLENVGEDWECVSQILGTPREQCITTYNELVRDAKKSFSDMKKSVMSTGGGPPDPGPSNERILEKVKGLIGPAIDGFYTKYDGDRSMACSNNFVEDVIEIINEKNNSSTRVMPHVIDHDYHSVLFSPDRKNLKRKQSSTLITTTSKPLKKKKETAVEKFGNLADEKSKLIEIQRQYYSVKLQNEEENLEHERQMREIALQDLKEKVNHNKALRELELKKYL